MLITIYQSIQVDVGTIDIHAVKHGITIKMYIIHESLTGCVRRQCRVQVGVKRVRDGMDDSKGRMSPQGGGAFPLPRHIKCERAGYGGFVFCVRF